ncbi:MAG: insulinase family protein [Candidatus Omnitrophica bacterium]|nr:insulinase family protein [Candidatus Omnitrophota bacterium]
MKKLYTLITLALLMTGGCAHGIKPDALKFPKLRAVEAPQFVREKLDNGITIFLMEDKSLPLINFQALVHTGTICEPEEKTGLAEITFETMRTGGAGKMSGDEIDYALERIGARISTGIDRDIASAGGLCRKENFPFVSGIFRDILAKPAFEPDKIALSVISKKGAISRRNDDISDIAEREFGRLVYGKNSPYARISEYATIDNISREDLLEFHGKHVRPENIILGIWGDFESEEMVETVKELFGSWRKSSEISPLCKPAVEFPQTSPLNVIVKKDATQSVIMIGHKGIKRGHPDYFTAAVLSRILGAGAYSRFSRKLREEKGLAYEVWALFIPEYNYPGLFMGKAQTRLDKTFEVIALMKQEIESVRRDITDEELAVAKEGILNSEVFWSDTKDKVITRLMRYEYYGYSFDYPEKLIEGVKKVTKKDVVRTANELLLPGSLTVLVVGNPEKFGAPLPPGANIISLTP